MKRSRQTFGSLVSFESRPLEKFVHARFSKKRGKKVNNELQRGGSLQEEEKKRKGKKEEGRRGARPFLRKRIPTKGPTPFYLLSPHYIPGNVG